MLNDDLLNKIKFLKLADLTERWQDYAQEGKKRNLGNEKFLGFVIEQTFNARLEQLRLSRIARAKIPDKYEIETYPFQKQPKLSKKKMTELYDSFSYIENKENVVFIGPTGAGKTGLATSLLLQSLKKEYSGRFIVFSDLIDDLREAVAKGTVKRVIKSFANVDCLLIDELGYIEVQATEVGLFFRLLQARHMKKCTIITTNLGFKEWDGFLKNPHLTSALVDRFTENCQVFNMKGSVSLRANEQNLKNNEQDHE